MNPDDKVCYCFDVSLRKLVNFARQTEPSKPSQMSECFGAGTGCGWCIPVIEKIAADPDAFPVGSVAPDAYAEGRERYLADKKAKKEPRAFSADCLLADQPADETEPPPDD